MRHKSLTVRLSCWAVAALSLLSAGCSDDGRDDPDIRKPELQEIILDTNKLTLTVGDEYTFQVSLRPDGVQQPELTWSSSAPEVAAVENGTVTALTSGKAVIEVRDLSGISASCEVIVEELVIPVESVTLDRDRIEVFPGETARLTATVEPAEADYVLVWSSSDPATATVDDEGNVTGLVVGETTVTVHAGDFADECLVIVKAVPVETIILNSTDLNLNVGETFTLTATVLPEDATDKSVVWSSGNDAIATVDGNGTVTAVQSGETVIRATSGTVSAECRVVVAAPAAAASVGDYFYSDGTWSGELDAGKTVIGVIFHVGDITLEDAALAREHPQCTHGLAVSITEMASTAWQSNNTAFNATVSSWIEANLEDYAPILAGGDYSEGNKPSGYNNTRAIEAFNAAAENNGWPVEAVQSLETFRTDNPAPETTSGWYVPSAEELSLLTAGDIDGDFTSISSTENLSRINKVLETIGGASKIQGPMGVLPGFYQSSSEADATMTFQMMTLSGGIMQAMKSEPQKMRPILAF